MKITSLKEEDYEAGLSIFEGCGDILPRDDG